MVVMNTYQRDVFRKRRIVAAICRLQRELSEKSFDDPTALLHFLTSRFKGLQSGWISYLNFFRTCTETLTYHTALRLSLSAVSTVLLADVPDGLPSFIKILSIKPEISDQLSKQKVHISYIPILTFGAPGLHVETTIPLHQLRRLLAAIKIRNYPMRQMSDAAGIYAFILHSLDGKWPLYLTLSEELISINTSLFRYRYCIAGKGKAIKCPACNITHPGRYKDCRYWKLPDTLDGCIQELDLLRCKRC